MTTLCVIYLLKLETADFLASSLGLSTNSWEICPGTMVEWPGGSRKMPAKQWTAHELVHREIWIIPSYPSALLLSFLYVLFFHGPFCLFSSSMCFLSCLCHPFAFFLSPTRSFAHPSVHCGSHVHCIPACLVLQVISIGWAFENFVRAGQTSIGFACNLGLKTWFSGQHYHYHGIQYPPFFGKSNHHPLKGLPAEHTGPAYLWIPSLPICCSLSIRHWCTKCLHNKCHLPITCDQCKHNTRATWFALAQNKFSPLRSLN